MITWFHADSAKAQFIFAHGAGAGMESEFMQTMAKLLQARGISVGLFDFEYMQIAKQQGKRRPPQRANKLLPYFEQVIDSALPDLPLLIGGKSMGGRMASMLACEVLVKGVVAFGYPFHPPGKLDKLRIEHFPEMKCPFLVIQGERDTFGKKQEVESYGLCDNVALCWVSDGDHSLVPRKSSGFSQQQNWQQAADFAAKFIEEQI